VRLLRSLIRIIAIADKEWLQIRRDVRSLLLSIGAPVLLILLFGYALNMDVNRVSTAIYDQDRSLLSRSLLEKFSHTEYISIMKYVKGYEEIDELIDSGSIVMAIVIPPDLDKRFKSGKQPEIQLVVDGSDSTSATVAIGYVKAIVYNFNREIMIRELNGMGISDVREPIEVRSRIWYNAELQSKNFIVPGLIVLIMAIISALITSLTISREWERGTMETLITTPVRGYEVILGKLIPYLFIGVFDVVFVLTIGYFVFDVPVRGSFLDLWLIAVLFLIGTTGLGIMISSATRVQVLSVQIAIISTFLPTLILSGFIFPIKNMPLIIQGITYLIPARYMIAVVKSIALKGIGYSLLWTQILFLFVFALLVIVQGIRKFTLALPEEK
jgi:ABC-2 type transport system permease protein